MAEYINELLIITNVVRYPQIKLIQVLRDPLKNLYYIQYHTNHGKYLSHVGKKYFWYLKIKCMQDHQLFIQENEMLLYLLQTQKTIIQISTNKKQYTPDPKSQLKSIVINQKHITIMQKHFNINNRYHPHVLLAGHLAVYQVVEINQDYQPSSILKGSYIPMIYHDIFLVNQLSQRKSNLKLYIITMGLAVIVLFFHL
eukprot:TRINITY_DN18682_c0_g2_i8.p3 TRINITY_DN18682_c0_g2~~TRINITY_DN18682_c0_g2_i8.p3  ORF type:complete len:198 (-),score=-10.32 TRINITY_DN18682_c0_g2_i8:63-656(-)